MGRPQTLETREKIRKALTKEKIVKICPECGTEFSGNKFCSKLCAAKQPKKKGKERKKGSGGFREGGGKAKQISYTNWIGEKMKLNKDEIKVAEILDQMKLKWGRNYKGFSYISLDGKDRKFYPDFILDENKYIEYKGWVTKEMDHKMKDAVERNNLELIIVVGDDPRYRDYGLTLKEFENMNFLNKKVVKSRKIDFGPYFNSRRRAGENKVTRNQDQIKDFFDAVSLEQDIAEDN